MNILDTVLLKINNYSLASIKRVIEKTNNSLKYIKMEEIINKVLPNEYINDKVMSVAINNYGYKVSKNSPSIVRNDFRYIKRNIDIYNDGFFINYMDEEKISDDMIKYSLKYFYTIDKNTPNKIKKNKEYLRYILKKYCCTANAIAFFKYYPTNEITEEDIKLIADKFNLTLLSQENITFKNKRLITYFIKYNNSVCSYDYLFKHCESNILTFDVLKLAADKGYIPSPEAPEVIKNNKELLMYLLKDKEKDCAVVSYFNNIEITDNLIDLFIEKDYLITPNTPDCLKNNYDFIKKLLEHATDPRHVDNIITFCNQDLLDDYLIDLAFKKGYNGGNFFSEKILSDYNYVVKYINNTGSSYILNKVNPNMIDQNLKDLALKTHYKFSSSTPDVLRKDYDFVKQTIINDVPVLHYGYDNHTLAFASPDIVDDDLITLAINHGFLVAFDHNNVNDDIPKNPKYISMMLDKLLSSKDSKELELDCLLKAINIKILSKEQITKIIKYYPIFIVKYFCIEENFTTTSNIYKGDYYFSNSIYKKLLEENFDSPVTYLLINQPILQKEVVAQLGIDNVIRIIKYGMLGNDFFPIAHIIEKHGLDNLILLYKRIIGSSIDNIDIIKFVNCTVFFYKYYDLVTRVINTNQLDNYIEKIKLLSENKYNLVRIDTLDKLDHVEEDIFKYNEEISNGNNYNNIMNSIYLILVNNTYSEINELLSVVSSEKIEELLKSEALVSYTNLLKYYKVLVSFIEYIQSIKDITEARKILKILNNDLLIHMNNYRIIRNNFKDVTKVFKKIYAKETQSKLTQIEDRESTDTFVIEDNKYKTRKHYINGEEITKKEVRYISISEEAYFLQHVMNAFGTGGKISDYKRRRGIGKSYICLSATSNKKMANLKCKVNNINNVILLFNNIKPSSLVYMSPYDIHSQANLNDLSIRAGTSYFDTIDNIITKSNKFSEYVVYREDAFGNQIYPCGILVSGNKPNRHEINAAAYLDIPLIKLLPVKKKTLPNIIEYEDEIINNEAIDTLNNVIKIFKRN